MSSTLLRFLVIGCGSIGKRHIKNLLALGAKNLLVYDTRQDRLAEARSELNVDTVDNLDHAWEKEPEVVLITTPTSSHVSLALQAAHRNCRLFIEKPLSDRLEGINELIEVVRKQNLISLIGCNMRFHPGILAVRSLLSDGAIGHVVAARAEAGYYLPDWHPWEDYRSSYSAKKELGGGIILDAIHEIDYMRWILGEVTAVVCFAGRLSSLEIDTEDVAAMVLRFASGAIGEIHLDYVQRTYSRTCEIIGEEGTIRWDYGAGEVRLYRADTREWQVFADPTGWEPNRMYVDEMRHFLRCLTGEEKSTLDIFEATRVLEVALQAKTSAETGKVMQLGG
ncbi:Gfo/Idh/MocA family oxidoreductase [Candidatus Bathyarchaeota archaeon]|jgi:predicted dehydrogenase|nr:Gfo/Idh/MocA family oxidoreductase [Candidatus Bathyarchaeota archaeon]